MSESSSPDGQTSAKSPPVHNRAHSLSPEQVVFDSQKKKMAVDAAEGVGSAATDAVAAGAPVTDVTDGAAVTDIMLDNSTDAQQHAKGAGLVTAGVVATVASADNKSEKIKSISDLGSIGLMSSQAGPMFSAFNSPCNATANNKDSASACGHDGGVKSFQHGHAENAMPLVYSATDEEHKGGGLEQKHANGGLVEDSPPETLLNEVAGAIQLDPITVVLPPADTSSAAHAGGGSNMNNSGQADGSTTLNLTGTPQLQNATAGTALTGSMSGHLNLDGLTGSFGTNFANQFMPTGAGQHSTNNSNNGFVGQGTMGGANSASFSMNGNAGSFVAANNNSNNWAQQQHHAHGGGMSGGGAQHQNQAMGGHAGGGLNFQQNMGGGSGNAVGQLSTGGSHLNNTNTPMSMMHHSSAHDTSSLDDFFRTSSDAHGNLFANTSGTNTHMGSFQGVNLGLDSLGTASSKMGAHNGHASDVMSLPNVNFGHTDANNQQQIGTMNLTDLVLFLLYGGQWQMPSQSLEYMVANADTHSCKH